MHASSPDVDRRVTFDRAVWTKPLAFAADAVESAMSVQSWEPRVAGRVVTDAGPPITSATRSRAPAARSAGASILPWGHTSGAGAYERDATATGEAWARPYEVSWVRLARSA